MQKTDVLIVGAGPTGLALACQLLRYGVDFIIIDKKETTTRHSKAIGVQARTLEVYEQIGLADKLIALGAPTEKVRMFAGGKVRGELDLTSLGTGLSPYPYVLIVEQGKHERLVYEYITSHGRDVRWRCEMTSFTQDETGVTAQISTESGPETINAKYLAACDGAKSPVRHALGLSFEGSTFERMFYVADVDIDWAFGHDALQVFLMTNTLLAFFPMSGEKQYRIVGTFPEEFAKDEGDVLYEEIEERIKKDVEIELDITHVNWFSTYKVHTRHVNKFVEGRCFVAGDAAHIHTPAGAQGMNTGIQDAYNLAWKMALVLKGKASENLFASYDHERLENAAHLTRTTDRFFNLVASPGPLLAIFRLYIFPYIAQFLFSFNAVKKFVFPLVSQIGISYRSSNLSKTNGSFRVKAGDRMPYFMVNGESIYNRVHKPVFHVLSFSDDGTDPLPETFEAWSEMTDKSTIRINSEIAATFGHAGPFVVVLRPDNYIGLISDDVSAKPVLNYLNSFS